MWRTQGRIILALVAIIAGLWLWSELTRGIGPAEVSYTKFKELVAEDQVASATLRGHDVTADLKSDMPLGPDGAAVGGVRSYVPEVGDPAIVRAMEDKGVDLTVRPTREGQWDWLWFVLPWVLIVGLYVWFWRRMQRQMMGGGDNDEEGGGSGGFGPMGGMGNLLNKKPKKVSGKEPKVDFDQVAGQETAKKEVHEVIEFLKDPDRFRKLGADVPHGLLLTGPPGTGKTLLARAVAGEAEVPFFHMSASEFIEAVVGVGASRVRKAFEQAKKEQPSIIFIDELDSVGRTRGAGLGGGHDEREQTLNQILAEMDGFSPREAVIVMAATNRPDVLDKALLRPGRFDRRVSVDLPDKPDRVDILKVHTRDKPVSDDVDLKEIAAGTPGFSGADLENLANEAAILAARDEKEEIGPEYFDLARDKLMMGAERPLDISTRERRRLAVHECGHTAVAHFCKHADPVHKVTIIPRGQALGGTHQLPEKERYTMDEDYLWDRLAVSMGGRVAEKLFLGSYSSGTDHDIQQSTDIARRMVTRWGMSSDVGPVDHRQEGGQPFLGQQMASGRDRSDQTLHEVDEAVRKILFKAEDKARGIIEANRDRFETLAEALQDEETLNRDAVVEILGEGAAPDGSERKQAAE